ncbi:MAG: Ig-like domain-containing protein [Anaerolineales bacterium]|nr:Ig-like domain-containing protein [Anaerolineales bacterium]
MRKLLFLSLALLLFGALSGSPIAQSQDPGDAVPPQVIDIWPLPGVELSPDEPLTITFNQAMDQASVESALHIQPSAEGGLVWSDARTLNVLPDVGWQRATEYAVMLDDTAKASTGLTLAESLMFSMKTVGPLEVATVVPADGAEGVAADSRIVVTFNRPVVPLVSTTQLEDLPTPIRIEPSVEGQGEWLNTGIYMFTPAKALQGGTKFTVTVTAGLTAVDSAVLGEDFSWSFETLPPQILSVSPYDGQTEVLLESGITANFSQPMEQTSTEAAFALMFQGEPVAGAFSWNSDFTSLTFTPTEYMRIDSMYLINVSNTAKSANGEAPLNRGLSQSFRTVPYPGVSDTSPDNRERGVYPGYGATIYFKSPMNMDTLEGKLSIEPAVEWLPSAWDNRSVYMSFVSLPQTRYTITLKAGAEDVYGNAISTDYTFSYTTGEISTWAYPLVDWRSPLLITGAHRQNSRISMEVSGTPNVDFWLYQIDADTVPDAIRQVADRGGYYEDTLPSWATQDKLIRKWSQRFDSGGISGVAKEVLLAGDEGGTLPNGVYWLVVKTENNSYNYQYPLVVATATLTVKQTEGETLVWATDMPSGEPIQETTISIYQNNEMVAHGQTDSEGVFRAPVDTTSGRFSFIQADGAGAYAVWYSEYYNSVPDEQDYLYTDRPIYRPGETVYFRGAVRDRDDMTYTIPNQRTVSVRIEAVDGSRLYEKDLELTPFGTFSGELELPEDVAIGDAYIILGNWDYSLYFSIAEFRVPEFEVGVTAQQDAIFQGETLNAVIDASYYFGGGVSNADVYWSAYGYQAYFNYTGPGYYNFSDENGGYFYSYYVADGSGTTDANGQLVINTDNTHNSYNQPMSITVEATVTDESYQSISGRTSVLVHPADLYVGLRSDRYFGQAGEPMLIETIAVDTESQPLADKEIDLTFVEIRWSRVPVEGQFGRYNWTSEEIEVETVSVRTNADGTASYAFTPPNAGIFRVRASAMDDYERTNSSSLRFWAFGDYPVWWGEPSDTIDLIADKETYQVGDTARVLVPIPFAGKSTVLVSTERVGLMSYEVLEVEGSTLLYEVPITEETVPTIHLTVTLVKGIDDESLNPDYRIGEIALNVDPVAQRLNVSVTPTPSRVQPGETVTFDIEVTDADGNPVQGEVGLVLTDKAILALSSPNSTSLESNYYGYQWNYVTTSISIVGLIDRLTDRTVGVDQAEFESDEEFSGVADGVVTESARSADAALPQSAPAGGLGGGEGAQQPNVTVREDFQQTPLWAAHVITDENGHATVSVDVPDNLTTWTLDARTLTADTKVGQATTEVVTTLPLLIRPVTPRFLVVGDRVELASVINNNTTEDQTVEATLQATGVILESDITQSVTVPAGGRVRVEWIAVAEDVPYIDLTFIALNENGYSDAAKPSLATGPDGTIPVYRYTAPDKVGTGGILREGGSRVEGISLPPRLDEAQGELIVHADPSLAVTTIDSLDYLKNYPHQCIEQTVSRFLPNVITYRALQDLGINDPNLEANLVVALEQALNKLRLEQNYDGGWGWFYTMESNPMVTAYAALGLIEARDAGFEVEPNMLSSALNFVRQDYIRPNINSASWQLNRQAFYLYVLSRDGQGSQGELESLLEWRLNMSYAGRAYLLMAYHELFPEDGAIQDLISDLTTAAIVSATGAHWEEDSIDWWNWSSDTRTTALVLSALVRTNPESDLLPNAVRWLMVARNGDHWETTQETVWAVISLTDWMKLTGELQGEYTYSVSLNREGQLEGDVTPDTVRDGQVLRVAVSDLLKDEVNRLVFARDEGQGVLYYTAHLDLRLLAEDVDKLNRGVLIERQYFLEGDPATPITSATVGDVINVQLTFTLSQDIYYFVLEDPIPAGTEPVDTSLLTTSQLGDEPTLTPTWDDHWWWWWGWWYYDRTELRDEQANLYADFLPRGTYTYTYQIRASVPGEFQTMPSQGYAFYFPEVFGRTAGSLFTVSE